MEKLAQSIRDTVRRFRRTWNWPQDWILKVISLFFAGFLWFFVVGEDKVDTTVFVPIEIINLPRDLVISNQFKRQLEVRISAPRGLARGLSAQHITRSVDLSDAKPGSLVIQNRPEDIDFPRGIKILRIQPANVTLLIDRLIEKELAIKPTFTGSLPKGYEIVSTTLDPATITLTAPAAVLSDEVFLSTEEINLSKLTQTTKKQVTLDLKPEIAEIIGETYVNVTLNIGEKKVEKTINNIPLQLVHDAERTNYRLETGHAKIKAVLPYNVAQQSMSEIIPQFTAIADADSLPPGQHEIPVTVNSKDNYKILNITPKSVIVHIGKVNPAKKRKNSTGATKNTSETINDK